MSKAMKEAVQKYNYTPDVSIIIILVQIYFLPTALVGAAPMFRIRSKGASRMQSLPASPLRVAASILTIKAGDIFLRSMKGERKIHHGCQNVTYRYTMASIGNLNIIRY